MFEVYKYTEMEYAQNGYNLTDTSRYQWWISFEEINSPLATSIHSLCRKCP